MTSFLPPITEEIDDLKSEIIMSLELQRGEGADLEALRELVARLDHATRPLLTDQPGQSIEHAFGTVEAAYLDWKAISAAFAETLQLAYNNAVPRSNLLIDDVHASAAATVGDPLADRYANLRTRWRRHIAERPWDAYKHDTPSHIDSERLERTLTALVRGDDLDVEDALSELTGELRHAFADYVDVNPDVVEELELSLWKRPEFLIASDYWSRKRPTRLVDVLRERGSSRFRDAMALLDGLFAPETRGAAAVVDGLHAAPESLRDRLTRCLMLHPDHEVRSYAVGNSDLNSIWKVLMPESVPCATILSLLEHITGASHYTTAQMKIFFDTIYRRLLSLSNRSDVLYARNIVRIFTKLDFFMEDRYFNKLMTVLDYLEAKEKLHGIEDGIMKGYIDRLRNEKEKVGPMGSHEPSFSGVPLVVLRKLARDGHFWYLLSMHPIVKVAREVVPHIATRDRAVRAAENHRINQEVLRAIGKNRALFSGVNAKLALLSNPRTPPAIALDYVADLTRRDLESLLRRGGLHPELRTRLRDKYNASRR